MVQSRSLSCVTVLAAFCSLPVLAQSPEEAALALAYGEQDFVMIATGTAKPLHLAPAVASLITAEEIKTAGATTLDAALALVPGVHVGLSPFNRLNPNWSIRGISTDQTPQVLLLRDGVPITHFYNGARPNLFLLPVESIERIEVMRGPGSAVYGADGFAGVINVITKSAADLKGIQAGLRVGSFEQRDGWLQYGSQLGDWNLGVSLEFAHSAGDAGRIVNSDLQSVFDGAFGTSASRAPGPLATGYDVLNASLKLNRGPLDLALWHWRLMDAGVGAGAAQALDPGGRQDTDLTQIDARYRLGGKSNDWASEVHFSHRELHDYPKFTVFPAGAQLPVGSDGNIASTPPGGVVTFSQGALGQPTGSDHYSELDLTATYTGWAQHQLRLNLGVKQERETTQEKKNFGPGVIDGTEGTVDGTLTDVSGTSNVFMPSQNRIVKYLSVQDLWTLARDWELTAGVRYDTYSDFGDTVNPRLALVWSARQDLTAKLLYGRAFRAPSFGEQHVQNNPVVLGNANLRPETIDAYELAFDYRPSAGLTSRLNLFRYDIADLIDYVKDAGGTTSTAQNAQDRRGHGLELELNWKPLPALRLSANYAWQHAEDQRTGQTIPNTPEQMASLSLAWTPAPGWQVAPRIHWIADQHRAAGDPRAAIKDYSLTDLTVRHTLNDKHWEFAASVNNLFDQKAHAPTLFNPALGTAAIPGDYPLPGRSLWVELRHRLP